MALRYPLSIKEKFPFTIKEITEYIEGWDKKWQIKSLETFSVIYNNNKEELMRMAVEIAMSEKLFFVAKRLITNNFEKGSKIYIENTPIIDQLENEYASHRFLYEDSLRTALNIGIKENIKNCYYDLFLVCWGAGDYNACIEYLEKAWVHSASTNRPHNVYQHLCQLYLLKEDYSSFSRLAKQNVNEAWRKAGRASQVIERILISVMSFGVDFESKEAVSLFLCSFESVFYKTRVFVLPPHEVCKFVAICALCSACLNTIERFFSNTTPFHLQCDLQYGLTDMFLCVRKRDYKGFFQGFYRLIPHIYNDAILHPYADDIVCRIMENMIHSFFSPYISYHIELCLNIFNINFETLLSFLHRLLNGKMSNYQIDFDSKIISLKNRTDLLLKYPEMPQNLRNE